MAQDLSAVGIVGVVTVATRGDTGSGEVALTVHGASESLLAWSDEPIPRGAQVLVIDVIGPRTVRVIRSG